ncbi:hypothetical protein EIL87_17060 [Saccharopolyspora rhizosphaerae]|uniref:Uncharacterized protein n=1 Tax=Saccharopolyspora rhizosphaerae TaxID=2492662 RepID=A0A3R8NYK5_9PSEU|nr:hypothetical protein [Saccharopolyspora rhizosphaerae]RRO15711.1 hypothetical protein EIL87_17060 [Saccharopolyspora rhizosphaerae]
MSVRVYTRCAIAVTTSALAGLLVGALLVTHDQPARPAIEQVSQLTPAAGGAALPEQPVRPIG